MRRIMQFVFIAIVLLPVTAFAELPTHVFSDGFESGNLCKWNTPTCPSPQVLVNIAWAGDMAISPVGSNESQASYELDMNIGVSGGDVWIEKTAQRDAAPDGSDGMEFVLRDVNNNLYALGTAASMITADGSTSGDTTTHYKIGNGATRTFHLLVAFNNTGGIAGYYSMQLSGVSFDFDGSGPSADGGVIGINPGFGTNWVFVDSIDN